MSWREVMGTPKTSDSHTQLTQPQKIEASWRELMGVNRPSTLWTQRTQLTQLDQSISSVSSVSSVQGSKDCESETCGDDEGRLLEALAKASDDLPASARDLYDSLAPEVLAQFYTGEIAERDLRTFAQELYEGREREAGLIPESYQYVATCRHCGPVWLTIPGHVPSCPWCINRYNGWPIPRPGSVTCATCRHFRRRDHPHLGDCGAGVKPYGAAGFWDTDRHGCKRWLPNDKDSGRE